MTNMLSGIAVVIDDTIHEKTPKDQIHKIISQIEEKNIPIAKYDELPENEALEHFSGISFVILDWNLKSKDLPDGVLQSEDQIVADVIDFIKTLKSKVFGPIFIFTATNVSEVKAKLKEAGISDTSIIVASKGGLLGGKLFTKLEEWIKSSPPVYVFKEWEREYNQAKNSVFIDFFKMSHSWPKVLWENFKEDGVDTSFELGEVITKNIQTRMSPFNFDETHVCRSKSKPDRKEIQSVLQGERYLSSIEADASVTTGDIFKESYQDGEGNEQFRYYLNIRAQCDTLRKSNPELHLLKGKEIKIENYKDKIHEGAFMESRVETIVPFIDEARIIRFEFFDLHKKKWNSIKVNRIGRLLDPYITSIQQRYSLHQQRKGLPRIPAAAFPPGTIKKRKAPTS
ncbi:MAG: hypothetical protein PSN37_05575 [Alphaproteobacteria bacterium]|nr:hypothetical protein [Alphaproteobacteria bacterium]